MLGLLLALRARHRAGARVVTFIAGALVLPRWFITPTAWLAAAWVVRLSVRHSFWLVARPIVAVERRLLGAPVAV